LSFGVTFDKGRGARASMSDPRAAQRRTPPAVAFEPIQRRLERKFAPRVARGDQRPVWGEIQYLPDGTPGGQPIPNHAPLMAPLARAAMPPRTINSVRGRTVAETRIQAARFQFKPRITLLQLEKPRAFDAAFSLRGRIADRFTGKPAPPVDYQGGFSRVFERNRAYPKDTSLAMQPIAPIGVRNWATSLPTSPEV